VGRVLSRLALCRKEKNSIIEDIFVCMEPPEKDLTVSIMQQSGIRLLICPDQKETDRLLAASDIVQIEWWHHPLIAEWMCKNNIRARLIVWSHTSGLHYPAIPRNFVALPHVFLFTSPVSRKVIIGESTVDISESTNRVDVVHSSGGFDDIPLVSRSKQLGCLSYGYLGSLNFAKLHPEVVDFIKAVEIPGFAVDFFGDPSSNKGLKAIAEKAGISDRVNICGFTERPYDVLGGMDVFVYLLNPYHYGTTENALLEAMACGVVPVVLNNPIEASIVSHGHSGIVVDSPGSFSQAISYLNSKPDERCRISETACREIRARFSLEHTEKQLNDHYLSVMECQKMDFEFGPIFGNSPAEWFASCLGSYRSFFAEGGGTELRKRRLQHPVLYEKSKSSVFHYHQYFPDDPMLAHWVTMLEDDLGHAGA